IVLQLIKQKLLSLPILYVSGYINKNRSEYYKLLQAVRTDHGWHDLIFYMLKGFHQQAKDQDNALQDYGTVEAPELNCNDRIRRLDPGLVCPLCVSVPGPKLSQCFDGNKSSIRSGSFSAF